MIYLAGEPDEFAKVYFALLSCALLGVQFPIRLCVPFYS